MRTINNIVIHCSATSQRASVESILRYWKQEKKWKNPGYHFIIPPSGEVIVLLPLDKIANGVAGHNSDSVHLCYIGGLKGDDRTDAQRQAMFDLVRELKEKFPNARILGHTDFPGVSKLCPNFNVSEWLSCVGIS